ncbi:hypothetical protein [Arthrobacter roseus]|uniref:hypothetical protein n=1 Tax=Arthrobacter roseus TaxID=136274 RepID=UPI001EF8DA8A|nr:hypothetical protein [Arthrobacter roseus]MBM7848181.1 cation transport ATPase [Arthrobacter roseus]
MTGNPRRIRVQSPKDDNGAQAPYTSSAHDDDVSSESDAYVSSLMRSQFRLAIVVASGFILLLLGVPVLVWLSPALAALTIFSIPLRWLLLGVLMYPVMITAAWLFIRAASRNETRYRQLTDKS